jgi:hypothetical protein
MYTAIMSGHHRADAGGPELREGDAEPVGDRVLRRHPEGRFLESWFVGAWYA